MKICTLASGSRGNCIYVESASSALLIDQGLPLRELQRRAEQVGLDLAKVQAIAVTHEHSDHIRGVQAFCDRYGIKAFMSPLSVAAAPRNMAVTSLADNSSFDSGTVIGDMRVTPYRLHHDAAYTVGYQIEDGHKVLCTATDLGYMTESVGKRMCKADAVLVESNHDIYMLEHGKYPYMLKQRILGKTGHLSNADAARVSTKFVQAGVKRVILAHLSQDNNTPQKAYAEVVGAMTAAHITQGKDVRVDIAYQFEPSLLTDI